MIWNTVISYIVSVSLIVSPMIPIVKAQEANFSQMSSVPDGSVQYQLYTEKMDLTIKFSREMRATLDRTTFDLDALLASLDYDAESIIQFVKNAIAFEQYPGVLRGPQGTLFSRAGNSIDQSLLLANLLKDAGYDARIVEANIDTKSAAVVLQAMQQPVQPAPPFGDADAILDVFERYELISASLDDETRSAYADYVRAAPKASDLKPFPAVAATTKFIRDQLDEAGVKIGSSKRGVDLIEEARQYFWVQFKEENSEPWIDVHPIFVDDIQFSQPEITAYFVDTVPENLQHKFRFQVFIERKVGERFEVLPVTTPWERPVANLINIPLTFTNIPDAMMSPDAIGRDPSELLMASKYFAASFGHATATGEQFFDLYGNLIDPMVAGTAASDLFATVNSAFGDAIGALGNRSSIPTLTAQWLEFTLISPNGDEQIFRRTTFDRIGVAGRSQKNVPVSLEPTGIADVRSLVQLHTFVVGAGTIPRGFVLEAGLSRFESARNGYDGLMSRNYGVASKARAASDIPVSWAKFLPLLSYFDVAQTIAESHRNYRSGPALYVHSIGLGRGEGHMEAMDIVSNPWRAIDIRAEVPSNDPEIVIQAGVWETAVEGALLSGHKSFDTWQAFQAAERAGVEPVVLLPGASASDVVFPADVRAAIDIDLKNGYAVIVPRVLESIGEAGWWRVNIETGETVGRIRDGRGGVIIDYLKKLGVLFSGILLVLSWASCVQNASSIAITVCCALGNTLVTILTYAFGSLFELTNPSAASIGLYASVGVDTAAYNLPIGEWCDKAFTPIPPPAGWNQWYPSISAPQQ